MSSSDDQPADRQSGATDDRVFIGKHREVHRARRFHTNPDCRTIGLGNELQSVARSALDDDVPECKVCAGTADPGGPPTYVDGHNVARLTPEQVGGLPPIGERR